MRGLQAVWLGAFALFGGWDCRAAEAVLVPAAGLTYRSVSATRTTGPGMAGLNLQVITTEVRIERSDGKEALARRVYHDLPEGSPLVNGENNYSIFRYFTVAEYSLELRPRGSATTMHQVVRNDCDDTALASFFPLGRIERVEVECTQTVSRDGVASAPSRYTMTVSYEGMFPVSGGFGDTAAHRIRMVWSLAGSVTEGVIAFDDTRGLILTADYTVSRGELTSSTHSTLTSVSP